MPDPLDRLAKALKDRHALQRALGRILLQAVEESLASGRDTAKR
ncbi:MAG: hypothetical protein OEY20_10010 [Gemmatimonadota bacterium]|nr:hypothetical protein [Gemmatimonadota bacterium]MDH4349930.1 hypothetical protein [Gemmatimonadota bacterium]MDH5197574.1 hypothetical protein [Gemmatimonadota bacterium]